MQILCLNLHNAAAYTDQGLLLESSQCLTIRAVPQPGCGHAVRELVRSVPAKGGRLQAGIDLAADRCAGLLTLSSSKLGAS